MKRADTPLAFPSPETANADGLLAAGGNLAPGTLLAAYRQGIFPWFGPGDPILWWSPDPRAVILVPEFRVRRSLAKTLRHGPYRVTFDSAFPEVIRACATTVRKNGQGTWIVPEMISAYEALAVMGHAHSVETWLGSQLVGGLYGVSLGRAFFGESMFAVARDASKVALCHLAFQLRDWGFDFIDGQIPNAHLSSLGAIDMPRTEFLRRLAQALQFPGRVGRWTVPPGLPGTD